ncbi:MULTISPECIES: pilin [unclassified Variovorax]|uniref:pilin n=1 Tax=unclassified Variovorax TaxID=663243 RepID=UPI003F46431F
MTNRSAIECTQRGFTLIELMIVVAIIGILAAIAIPQYQTYVVKSQVARVVSETGTQKTAVEDCINSGQITAGQASDAAHCGGTATGSNMLTPATGNTVNGGAPALATQGAPVLNFVTAGGPTIVSTFGGSASTAIATATITWTRNAADGSWACVSTVLKKYAPSACPTSSAT